MQLVIKCSYLYVQLQMVVKTFQLCCTISLLSCILNNNWSQRKCFNGTTFIQSCAMSHSCSSSGVACAMSVTNSLVEQSSQQFLSSSFIHFNTNGDFSITEVRICCVTIAHPNCTPPGLCQPRTGTAKLPVPRIPIPIVYATFDIGLGEQHKLNCQRQRGTRKASWDGLGKYTEFYLTLVRSAPITSKCDCCCK